MKIGIDNALGVHPQALLLRAQRTEVLARNIANADTPGYKARDIDFHAVLKTQTARGNQTASMARTNDAHLNDAAAAPAETRMQYRLPMMPSLDGNTVEAQVEQAEFAQNSMQYMASLRLLNGKLKGLMTAIKGE